MNPDTAHAIKLACALSSQIATFAEAKMRIEYTLQAIRAKGLLPNPDGSAPAALGVEGGTIGGNSTALRYEDYALALAALAEMVEGITEEIAPGVTVEAALLRFMAV